MASDNEDTEQTGRAETVTTFLPEGKSKTLSKPNPVTGRAGL
jgi:hypothetical protein